MRKKKSAHETIVTMIKMYYVEIGTLSSSKACGHTTAVLCDLLGDTVIPEKRIPEVILKLEEIAKIEIPPENKDRRISALDRLIRNLKSELEILSQCLV